MLPVAIVFQLLTYVFYPIAILLWRIFVYEKQDLENPLIDEIEELPRHSETRESYFLANIDDHASFTHVYLWLMRPELFAQGLHLLGYPGDLACRFLDETRNYHKVSGDCVIFYAWAFALAHREKALLDSNYKTLKMLIDTYVKYLGFRTKFADGKFAVSARCANFGVNIVPDGAYHLSQPCFGPQFYTTSALLALGARHLGGKYKVIYWVHYVLFGGWLWWLAPVLYTKKDKLGYVRDVTMKGLHVLRLSGYGNFMTRFAEKFIRETIAEKRNPLFFAISGKLPPDLIIPKVYNPWSTQTVDIGNGDELSANTFTRDAIMKINRLEIS